jgi:hypothetical protein
MWVVAISMIAVMPSGIDHSPTGIQPFLNVSTAAKKAGSAQCRQIVGKKF